MPDEQQLLLLLRTLSQCPQWDIRQLPADITWDVLRCFDAHGWVQLQTTAVENGRERVVCRWFSAMRCSGTAGDWDIIFRNYIGTRAGFSDRTCYVRLTDVAKATLTEEDIAKVPSAAGPSGYGGRMASWVLTHIVGTLIAGVLLTALLAWLGLG